jgi:chromosome partitioning protein
MRSPTIVTVLQCKGGVGKTTVATNLAAAAHLTGLRTLLLDLEDPKHRGLASVWFALRTADSPLRELVTHLALDTWTPSHFQSVAATYDLVVCDAPASLARATLTAAIVSDFALVPMLVGPAEIFALDPVGDLIDQADRQRAKLREPPLRWSCVFNRVQMGTRENQAMAEQLSTRVDVVHAVLGDRLAYRRAIAAGECALTYRPRDQAAAQEAWALFEAVLAKTPLADRMLKVPEALQGARKRHGQRAA